MGNQRPRILKLPDRISVARGKEIVDFSDSCKMGLDNWQRYVVRESLATDLAGQYSAFEVAAIVARQNGKGEILMARELGGLFVLREKLILHSAHEFKTAQEHFLRVLAVVENTDALRKRCKKPRMSHGEEGIELLPKYGGGRLRFVARSNGSGRGFTGDLIVLDEAFELSAEAMAALLPTLSARPNPQLWYASSAGLENSEVLRGVRARGMDEAGDGLAYFEWSAPDDADPLDRVAWAQANPALGIRITEKFIEREQAALDPIVFARERMGIWFDPDRYNVVDMHAWADLADVESMIQGLPVFGIDVTPDRKASALAAYGKDQNGHKSTELIKEAAGYMWIIDAAKKLTAKWEDAVFVIDPGSPAGALIAPLKAAKVRVETVSVQQLAQGCGAFIGDVENAQVRHRNQAPLTLALAGATQRPVGDGLNAWSRKTATVNISPLVAVTLAQIGFAEYGEDDDYFIAMDVA